jgi:hypothetical protein
MVQGRDDVFAELFLESGRKLVQRHTGSPAKESERGKLVR